MAGRIVLVTGFAPFGGATANPSSDVARALDGHRVGDVRFVAHAPLAVTYGESTLAALAAARHIGADAILAIGVAGGTTHVRIERRAANAASAPEPDAKGERRKDLRADDAGPLARHTALDVGRIAACLRDAGLDAVTSDDAGGYVCNDLYYRLLSAAVRLDGPRHVIFVHVPANAAGLTGLPPALARAFAHALIAL